MPKKVIAVGDSVVWGQGLQHADKFASLFFQKLTGSALPEEDLHGHSGAIIGVHKAAKTIPVGLSAVSDFLAQHEVPLDAPTMLEQIGRVDDEAARLTDVVLLNGGINDIGVDTILSAGFDTAQAEHALEIAIRTFCHDDMHTLVETARVKFPHALLLVLGYYPILSEDSNLDTIKVFLMSRFLLPIPVSDALARQAIRNSMYFHRRQLYWSRRAVAEANADPALRGPGVVFVHPAFGIQNSVGAADSFLFAPIAPAHVQLWMQRFVDAIDKDNAEELLILALQLDAQELDNPVFQRRKAACDATFPDDIERRIRCRVAAIGHPNVAGAQHYAAAIAERYAHSRELRLRAHLQRLSGSVGPISTRTALERYGLDPRLGLRVTMQHMIVDCIQVTITTETTAFAGTDDNVFFDVGGRRWLLNEDIFALDTANDFEAGGTGTYTIDPAMDTVHGSLHLGDIKEIRLTKQSALGVAGDWRPESIAVQINGLEMLRSAIDIELTMDNPTWVAENPGYPRNIIGGSR